MTSLIVSSPLSAMAKIHRRNGSATSTASTVSPFAPLRPHATWAGHDESLSGILPPPPAHSSTPKIKPTLRKMSLPREDQGYVDLSKSVAENQRLLGLGIQDIANPLVAEGAAALAQRRQTHARTTIVESQASVGSASFRPNQPFTHPMKQTPGPYTPPTALSYASSVNDDDDNDDDEEASGTADVVEHEPPLPAPGIRTQRSTSISSVAPINPTPLSQSQSASDFFLIPSQRGSASQTNLSTVSGRSATSKKSRPRRGTEPSLDMLPSLPVRGSFDQAIRFSSRRSETESQSQDERIRAARRKFLEKEAHKDRKAARTATKRRGSENSKAETQEKPRRRSSDFPAFVPSSSGRKSSLADDEKNRASQPTVDAVFQARRYEESRPANISSLPHRVYTTSVSEKTPTATRSSTRSRPSKGSESQWLRFSTWLQTRMLSCGGRRD